MPSQGFIQPRFILLKAVFGLLLSAFTTAGAAPVYLAQPWFHKAEDLNLLNTPEGHRLVVDDDGRWIADASLIPDNRNIQMRLDSIHETEGVYYLGRDLGNHGYDYFPLGERGKLPTGGQVIGRKLWGNPQFRAMGYHMDYDPRRGDLGLAIFPEAGVAITCGQTQIDSRAARISLFDEGTETSKPASPKQLPIYTGAGSSVRSEDFPDRAFVDHAGGGFWYLGSAELDGRRHLMLTFVTPEKTGAGEAELTHPQPVAVGDFQAEQFENGLVIGDQLFLLIAAKDPSVGGVKAERRLLRIGRETLEITETSITFEVWLDEVRLAAAGDDLAVYSRDALCRIDADTLEVEWRKNVHELVDSAPGSYGIARVEGDPQGKRLAVALATPDHKPGESTRLLALDPEGRPLGRQSLKPGPVDELVFTDDGGLLVFSAHYTAKIGGKVDVKANEATAIAIARKAFAEESPALETWRQSEPSFLEQPLKERFKVWFDQPARGFGRASLPLGNGPMGVMLDGGTDRAELVFNVDSHWTGDSRRMGAYQGFGKISVMLGHDPEKVSHYRRELDLRTGIHKVSYSYEGVTYHREAFASHPTGLFAIRFTADQPGALSGELRLMSNHPAEFTKARDGISFAGTIEGNGRKFAASLEIDAEGGSVETDIGKDGVDEVKTRRRSAKMPYNTVRLKEADRVTLYLAAATDYSPDASEDFRGEDPAQRIAPQLAQIQRMSFDTMKAASATDVATLFDRCTLDLATVNPEAEALPVDQRKEAYRKGDADPGFEALVFAAQRYMMIACSRPGSLPANLQGIWNDSNWPAWTSDYHADINIQMAYWFTEPANLAECNEPLFDYIESQIPVRRRHSKAHYGDNVRGWNVHYMNNIFGGYSYKDFPAGSAWYAQHYAEHFKFNQNRSYLEERAYPLMKELCQHWEDILIERPDGQLVTPRTMSPEHKPPQYGISQDVQLVYNLFDDFIAASQRLGRDEAYREKVADMRDRLLPIKIGRWGQIQEWERDRDNRYSTHRHHHQMIAAYPDARITTDTPELAKAVVTGLEARGTGRTGWSQVWRIPLFARVGQPELAYRQVRIALRDFHDHLIWQSKNQIDAPCGYAAGVCEMLLQSHRPLAGDDSRFLIELLPALPEAWPTGKVTGLRARGGFEVDIQWADGKLTEARIRNVSSPTEACVVRYGDRTHRLTLPQGEELRLTP